MGKAGRRDRKAGRKDSRKVSPIDVVTLLADGESFSSVSTKLDINRLRVPALVRHAFQQGFVRVETDAPLNQDLMRQLNAKFPSIEPCVIDAAYTFTRTAARQILEWIRDCLERCPEATTPFVAIGGGETLEQTAYDVATVLDVPENAALRDYVAKRRVVFVNATAGGLADNPTCESSHVACVFGQNAGGKVNIFSLSTNPSPDEEDVVKKAVKNTIIIVSGVGDRNAYCAGAMEKKKVIQKSDLDRMAGEFLFHCFDNDGRLIPVSERNFEIKEKTVRSGGRDRAESPVLATLAKFESLQGNDRAGEPNQFKYRVAVARAPITEEACARKAAAINVLARNLYLTHLCVSSELARAILKLRW